MDREPVRSLSLKAKLHAIMSEVSYIQKDKANAAQNYRYASEAAIKERLHEAFVKYGVLFRCDPVSIIDRDLAPTYDRDGKEKTRQVLTTCTFAYCFEDVDSDDKREGTFASQGVDPMDKGAYKAITGGIKYCLTTQFLIPTGDDPEGEDGRKSPKEKKDLQRQVAEQKLQELESRGAARPVPASTSAAGVITEAQGKRMYAIGRKRWEVHEMKALLKTMNFESSKLVTADKYDFIIGILERGPNIVDVGDTQQDPLEYPGERIRTPDGVVWRANADASAWERMSLGRETVNAEVRM